MKFFIFAFAVFLAALNAEANPVLVLDRTQTPQPDVCLEQIVLAASAAGPSLAESIVGQLFGNTAKLKIINRISGEMRIEQLLVSRPSDQENPFGLYDVLHIKSYGNSVVIHSEPLNYLNETVCGISHYIRE